MKDSATTSGQTICSLPTLSHKNGGSAMGVKTYCRLYYYRPVCILKSYLCIGDADCPPCPDLILCLWNEDNEAE